MTRVLVTGGAGFIGSHTVDALLRRGYEVRVLDALRPPVHDGTVPSYLPREVEFMHGDVREADVLRRALAGCTIVYHLAAYQDYLTDFSTFFSTNATSTALLYELIVTERRQVDMVVVASSQAVYGEGRYACPRHGVQYPGPRPVEQLERGDWEHRCPECRAVLEPGWTDESVMQPHNAYALSKRDQDDFSLLIGRRYGIPTVAFRYSIVQGPRQSFRNAYSGALRTFTVQIASGHRPVVYEDGRQIRDYVGIADVVRANVLPLDRPEMAWGAYNVGGARTVTVLELARLVARQIGREVEPELSGLYRMGDTRHVRSDVTRLRGHGWDVQVPLERVVAEYAEWALASADFHGAACGALERMKRWGVVRQAAATAL